VGRRKTGLLLAFLRGVAEIPVKNAWYLLVKLWWVCGDLWTRDDTFLSAKNLPTFRNFSVDIFLI